jgi:hypothetical protein
MAMAVVMDRPMERSEASPIEEIRLDLNQSAPFSEDCSNQHGSSLDGLLVWICINCWLLLVGMHVYELLIWMVG